MHWLGKERYIIGAKRNLSTGSKESIKSNFEHVERLETGGEPARRQVQAIEGQIAEALVPILVLLHAGKCCLSGHLSSNLVRDSPVSYLLCDYLQLTIAQLCHYHSGNCPENRRYHGAPSVFSPDLRSYARQRHFHTAHLLEYPSWSASPHRCPQDDLIQPRCNSHQAVPDRAIFFILLEGHNKYKRDPE